MIVGIEGSSIKREQAEKILAEKQGYEMIVNCLSWFNGEGFRCRTLISDAIIEKMIVGSGIEISDKDNPDTKITIRYGKLKDIKLIEEEKTIITYEFETVHIEIVF